MEIQTIRSERARAEISPLGAELLSLQDDGGTEYLWQGDAKYWDRRAPNLFPYIGRLTGGRYTYGGRQYHMGIHGFLPHTEMTATRLSGNAVRYFLRDSAATREAYPFPFALCIDYALNGCRLDITYGVRNSGEERMYFGMGGHPGFRVPLEPGLTFEDYELVFAEECHPIRVGLSERHFVSGDDTGFPLTNGRSLPLSHALFDDDAIVLREACREVALQSGPAGKSVTVSFPDMPYVGFWHAPNTDAPYICIEPWLGLPDEAAHNGNIQEKLGIITLQSGHEYNWTHTITIHE